MRSQPSSDEAELALQKHLLETLNIGDMHTLAMSQSIRIGFNAGQHDGRLDFPCARMVMGGDQHAFALARIQPCFKRRIYPRQPPFCFPNQVFMRL